jgi:hypothetical protein
MGGSSQTDYFSLQAYYVKTLMRFYFVSIVKMEHLLLPNFDHTKKSSVITHFLSQKNKKLNKIKKYKKKA